MMKKLLFVSFAIVLFGCAKKEEIKVTDSSVKSDTVKAKIVGADSDLHGCKTSAGYTWSVLRGECIRVFEQAERLNACDNADNSKMPAFVVFKDNKAEIFIQTEKPIILESSAPESPYINGEWELSRRTKVPKLKKSGKLLYAGDD